MTTKNSSLEAFSEVKYWIFDIDDTLYPKSSGLDRLIQQSISDYIADFMHIDGEKARKLCVEYYEKYGSTIRGLMENTNIKPRKFVREVHQNLDLSVIKPNPRLAAALEKLPGKHFVFTNGSYCHGLRISKRLGIEKYIDGFFGAQSTNFIPKPNPEAFMEFFTRYNLRPEDGIMVDDGLKNLKTIHDMGAATLWVAESRQALAEHQPLPDYVDFATADITRWLEKLVGITSPSED